MRKRLFEASVNFWNKNINPDVWKCIAYGNVCEIKCDNKWHCTQNEWMKFSVLTKKKISIVCANYRFLLQNGGRGIYFSAAIHYGFIMVHKTAAGQPSNQGIKKLSAASKLPRKHRYNNKKAISQTTDGFGPSGESRTHGLLNPIQARYQTALHPDNVPVSRERMLLYRIKIYLSTLFSKIYAKNLGL